MSLQVQSNTTQTGRQAVDLWGKALQTLDGDLKSRLNFQNSTKRNILEKTLKTAEEKKEVCLRKRWKFKRNGKEVVLRDVIEKIIKWLDHYKAVGDTAAQFDTAHAALPWAGVRFLLRVAVNDTHIFGSTIEALESVSHLIAQYAIFESVHIRRNTSAATELEPVLTEMYAEMLIFLARSMKYFQTPTATRMLKSALAAFESDENQQLKRITAAEAKVLAIATLSDAEMLNCFRDLEQPIRRMADQAAIYATSLEDARYREILNWLSVSCFIEHQERHAELRIQGTGQWFLNHREYLEWQSSSASSMFILHGMAGSGKSSLVSAVIGSFIEGSSNQPSGAPFAYFYCSKNASEVDRSNPKEIMRSIVRQLATTSVVGKSLHSAIVNEYGLREEKAKVDGFDVPRLGLQDCVRLILEITGSVSSTIILDAIDEVPPKSRHELLDALQQIVKDADDVVKVFLTTRDDDQILAMLSSASKLRIAADENRLDIEKFVHSQVSLAVKSRRLLGGDVSSELQADLSQALIDGAGEIFQLVIWQIEALCDMRHEIDIRKAMKHFSEDTLERMYTEILARIRTTETYSKKIAINAFSILHCLCEQLSSSSFLTAVAQMDEDHSTDLQLPELLRSCLGLIVLDSKMNVLRFAHTSVQEFLKSQHEFLSSKVNGLMAVSCLNTYLHGSPVKLNVGLRPKEYFYHYSTLYWAEHCKAAFRSDTNIKLLELLKQFIFEENEISLAFLGWLEDIGEYSKVLPGHHFLSRELSSALSQKPTPLFTASVFGLAIILDDIVKISDFDCNRKNDLGQTGLYLACFSGQRNIVSILLDHGADINISGGRLGNPLQASCFEGYIEITQLLVANGADPKLKGKFETALDASIEGDNEDIGLLLLEKGFEIKDQSEYDRILQLASQSGHIKIVQQLQKMHGSSFGNSGSAKCQAIQAAISRGQVAVVERFIKNSQNPRNDLPGDSIAIAALSGQNRMILLLLQNGLDIEHAGQFGTPLRAASLLGNESTVRLLLDSGAKNSGASSLGNALEAAAMNGHASIAKLLLQEGVDVNIKGGWSGNVLQAAAYRGHLKLVVMFLDAGASRYSSGFTRDAFHAAVDGGHMNILRLLLDRGYDDSSVIIGSSARHKDHLREASPDFLQFSYFSLVPAEQLTWNLSGSRAFTPPYHNRTALSLASRKSNLNIVEELLRCGASIVDPSGRWNALAEASQSHCKPLIELLLDQLPESIEQYACAAALSAAAASKDESVFQMLIAHGVAVSSSTLSQACAASLTNSALILLRAGVDIDGENEQGGNALQVAAFFQNETMVDILIEHGAAVNKVSQKYGSPLQAALEGLLEPILRLSSEHYSHQDELRDCDDCSHVNPPRPISEKVSRCKKIVGKLLDHGADINTKPRNYGTPLHLASFLGSASLVNLMLERGAEIDTVCDRFGTPLLAAFEDYSCHRIVPLLLEAGTNVNHISQKYGTPLHYSCEIQSVVMVRMLLEHGAEANAVCGSHGSPLSAALSRKSDLPDEEDPCQQIAEILLGEENHVKIEERDLIAVVKRINPSSEDERSYGLDLLRMLLEHDATLQATEPVLVAAINQLSSADTDSLELLLDRDRGLGIKEAMIEATQDLEILKVLLNHRPICRVTPEILAKMSENLCCSSDYSRRSNSKLYELLRLLIEHETDISITEDIVLLFLGADYTETKQNPIGFLFERNLNLKVTEPMLKAAKTVDHMKLLLKHAPGMKLNPEVLEVVGEIWQKADAVAKGMVPLRKLFLSREMAASREMILLLLAHDRTVKVPEKLLTVMLSLDIWDVGTLNLLNTVLDRDTNICLTADILTELVLTQPHFRGQMDKNQVQEIKIRILSLLLKYNKKVKFTGDIRTAIEREEESEGGAEMAALVYRLEDKGNEQT